MLTIRGTHEPIIDLDSEFMPNCMRTDEIVSEENFRILSDRLQDEQKKLQDELAVIKKRSEEFEKTEENIQSFVTLIKSMKHVDVLDRQIDIFYKFIGKVDF